MNAAFSSAAQSGRWWLAGFGAIVLGVAAVTAVLVMSRRTPAPVLVADSGDASAVLAGRDIYAGHCAVCHGKRLQGQAMWQVDDEDSWRRAPALDATGNAWTRSDAALISMVKTGRFPGVSPHARSAMPAFGGRLRDQEIVAALAYVKTHWPVALRVVQAALNPGAAGMPLGAAGASWQFPLICKGTN